MHNHFLPPPGSCRATFAKCTALEPGTLLHASSHPGKSSGGGATALLPGDIAVGLQEAVAMGAPEDDLRVAEPVGGVEGLFISSPLACLPYGCSAARFGKVEVSAIRRVSNQRINVREPLQR